MFFLPFLFVFIAIPLLLYPNVRISFIWKMKLFLKFIRNGGDGELRRKKLTIAKQKQIVLRQHGVFTAPDRAEQCGK